MRPLADPDLPVVLGWGRSCQALCGLHQRFQLDHLQRLLDSYRQNGLVTRTAGVLLIEEIEGNAAVGIVQYSFIDTPDEDLSHPEIGFAILEPAARGRGYATEAVRLLVDYLFAGYPSERITAFTDVENAASQRVLARVGFEREGVMRRASFRGGTFRDIALYGLLRGAPRAARG
ncbi:MAG: GNAT family protein [Minicystis sp.]